ncbi:OLC1v1031245C1 [Oldenlandia corymbosa var. corymbosa]|uniref:OLC1v1031245C1 n=1 Tax=Oldenlandia corymbosa var. corymbosa TaxID=529605 RepID=A0AAV1CL90_OLDCO|nr:OLC1v1031245C1 [Oldenlandia corymbosa var. corymbosa]
MVKEIGRKLLRKQVDQLFTASNLYNYLNVPPLDGGLLGLQEINADDLIKLQILQNTLQLMNPSPLPYSVQGNANLGDHLVQLDRLYNGATNDIPTVDPFQTHSSSTMSDWSTVSASLLNQMQQPLTSKSLPCFEIESVTTPWSVMNDRNSIFNSEYSFEPLPSLVTVTPESSTVTKLENTEQSYINTDQPDHDQLQTNQFEPWETLNVDDEANSSLWKDIFG